MASETVNLSPERKRAIRARAAEKPSILGDAQSKHDVRDLLAALDACEQELHYEKDRADMAAEELRGSPIVRMTWQDRAEAAERRLAQLHAAQEGLIAEAQKLVARDDDAENRADEGYYIRKEAMDLVRKLAALATPAPSEDQALP